MAKNSKRYNTPSTETQNEAMKLAKANQRPGQTKEQTKLIAQGIQKGIEQYKKQQKSKARDLDKKLKSATKTKTEFEQAKANLNESLPADTSTEKDSATQNALLPWTLLVISWVGFLTYIYL